MPNEMSNNTIREELVNTAVKFLTNPKIVRTSIVDQRKFLKRKGLTDDEIQLAFEKAGVDINQQQSESKQQIEQNENQLQLPNRPPVWYPQGTRANVFYQIREIVHNISVFSFVAYIVYKFYKRFIAPFLFGREKSTEETIRDLDTTMRTSMDELKDNLNGVKIEVDRLSHTTDSYVQRQLTDLKAEISTIKCLLLNRNQFPQPGKRSKGRPSIPEWQKSSVGQDSDADSEAERKAEDLLEVGSVSGSSEPEHNMKTSDSSLEIISYASSKECDSDFHNKNKEDLDKEY